MSVSLKQLLDEAFKDVKFDVKLAKAINSYQLNYVNRNQEHLEFFGSNLLGVHVIRFKDSDVMRLFDDVLKVDYYDITDNVKDVKEISQDHKVSSDTFNIICMYLIHRFLTSPIINDVQRKRAAFDCGLVFFYRCIAAIMSAWFRYPTDPKIAQAAYAKLSNKYLIKKLGSWMKVMEYRSEDLINKNNLHYKNLVSFKDTFTIVYAINDSQGRIRDLLKNYTAEFMKVHQDGSSINTTSSVFTDAEGEETVKEKTKSTEAYVTYLKTTVIDKHTFIKDDLITIVSKQNTNTSFRMIKQVLNWMHAGYSDIKQHNLLDEFITKVVVHSLYLIENQIPNYNLRDYPHILVNLKNLYLSTRSTDVDLIRIRELGESIVRTSNDTRISDSLMLSTRTAVILYLTLRALVGKNS